VAKGPGKGIAMRKDGMVTLRPAVQADRRRFYDWLRRFDGTPAHDGLPDFETFSGDEQDFFFDGSAQDKGRYFVIVATDAPPDDAQDGARPSGQPAPTDQSGRRGPVGRDVGCISYTCFHLRQGVAEIDLWLADESLCGRGLGTAAIRALLDRVRRGLGIHTVIIRPSRENARALRAYAKCGFSPMPGEISDYMLPEFLAPYGDGDFGEGGTVNLARRLERPEQAASKNTR
jgi:RimJ/RimL family protein N-acetyltransferase